MESAPATFTPVDRAALVDQPVPQESPMPAPTVVETYKQPAEIIASPHAQPGDEIVREVPQMPELRATDRPEQVLKLDWQTDLTQVETSPEKVRAARVRVEDEAPTPRPRRVRVEMPSMEEGPLLQVETHRQPDAAPRAPGG
jgi:hypothetical protein